MTQTTETTQQASEATQQTTSQPTAPTPPAEPAQQPSTPPPAPKSAFIIDGKLPQPEPQTAEPTASTEPTANSQELTASELKAQLTALQARLDAIESQRTAERRSAEVERIIAPLSDTLKAVYRRTPFATLTNEEYTQLTETIQKEVTELASADKARGAVFSRPAASKPPDGKASDKETEEVLRRLNL